MSTLSKDIYAEQRYLHWALASMNSLKPTIYSTHSQPDTPKCKQIHTLTNRYTQMHTDTCTHKQEWPSMCINASAASIHPTQLSTAHAHTHTHTHMAPAKRFHSLSSISTANSTIDSFLKHEPVCFFHICTDQTQKEGQRRGGGSGISVTGLQTWNPNQISPRSCSTCTHILQEMKMASAELDYLREI